MCVLGVPLLCGVPLLLTGVLQPVDNLLPEALCLMYGHGVGLHDDGDDGHVLGQLSHVAAGNGQGVGRQGVCMSVGALGVSVQQGVARCLGSATY